MYYSIKMHLKSYIIIALIEIFCVVSKKKLTEEPEDQIDREFNDRIESSLLELSLDQKEELTKEEIRLILLMVITKGNKINDDSELLHEISSRILDNLPEKIHSSNLKQYISFDRVTLLFTNLFDEKRKGAQDNINKNKNHYNEQDL